MFLNVWSKSILFLLTTTLAISAQSDEFTQFMGEATSLWKHVVSDEDEENLKVYQRAYLKKSDKASAEIPKIFHIIWLGSQYPKASYKHLKTVVQHHPDWKIWFWTDRKQNILLPNVEEKMVLPKTHLPTLHSFYVSTSNYAEKSDLLRYELLFQYGGCYLDHDIEMYRSINPLLRTNQFVCGIEPPHQPIISSSVSVGNNLIATVAKHPIIKKAIDNTLINFPDSHMKYLSDDRDSIKLRVAHATFKSFDYAVRDMISSMPGDHAVLPAGYFNTIGNKKGVYANHAYEGLWYQEHDPLADLKSKLFKALKKENQILILLLSVAAVNAATLLTLIYLVVRKRVWTKAQ